MLQEYIKEVRKKLGSLLKIIKSNYKNMTSVVRNILEVKRIAEEMKIDLTNFAYLPEVPMVSPFPREFMVEEIMGIKVLKLISTPNN